MISNPKLSNIFHFLSSNKCIFRWNYVRTLERINWKKLNFQDTIPREKENEKPILFQATASHQKFSSPTWHSPLKETVAYGDPFSRQVIVYRMPTKKGRIWFINMMNDNEGKVSTEELTLRSNIPRGLRIFWRIQIVSLSLSLSFGLCSPLRDPFSRAFHVQWKMKPDPYMYLRTCRWTLQDLSRIPRSANALLATLSRASKNFCSLEKRISGNLICPLAVGNASRLEGNISSRERETIRYSGG